MNRDSIRLAVAMMLAACAPAAAADWQCHSDGARAQAASDYLARAEQVYPLQLLAVLRSTQRVHLVNARDEGWSERVRQGLLELRLADPDITAARRFHASVSGPAVREIPAGEFACLERGRAARHGLALTSSGGLMLAAGRSVHLVDPAEPEIAVEVRAAGDRPLDLREVFAGGGRGIYAGLAAGRERPGTAVALKIGPAEHPVGEVVVTPRPDPVPPAVEKPAAVVVPAAAPTVPQPAPVPTVVAAPSAVARVESRTTPIASPARQTAAQATAAQSHGDYVKAMRALTASSRSGGVRSVSEMTYVHPAVEEFRNIR